jgi:hypothetical protein
MRRDSRAIVRSNFSCTFAFSLVNNFISVFEITDKGFVDDRPRANFEALDAQFLSSSRDSFLLFADPGGALSLYDLTASTETPLDLAGDKFTSCRRICQYRKDIVFGFISAYSTTPAGARKHAIYVYDLHRRDPDSEWTLFPVRRYRMAAQLHLPSDVEPIWFEFADGNTIFWASTNAIFVTTLDQAEAGQLLIPLDEDFGRVVDAAVTMFVAGGGKQFGLGVLGETGTVTIWTVDLTAAKPEEVVTVEATGGVSVQWSPMGSKLLVVPADETQDPVFIAEETPGEWVSERRPLVGGTSI